MKRDNGTLSPEAVTEMVSWTPTERLERVATMVSEADANVQSISDKYASFLEICDDEKAALVQNFKDPIYKRERFDEAKDFGNSFFDLVLLLGKNTPFLRYLVI